MNFCLGSVPCRHWVAKQGAPFVFLSSGVPCWVSVTGNVLKFPVWAYASAIIRSLVWSGCAMSGGWLVLAWCCGLLWEWGIGFMGGMGYGKQHVEEARLLGPFLFSFLMGFFFLFEFIHYFLGFLGGFLHSFFGPVMVTVWLGLFSTGGSWCCVHFLASLLFSLFAD